jgi:putative FmdB family regulatory protein
MPTYQYACTSDQCGLRFERVQAFTDPAISECPDCNARVRKVYSSVGVVFKGSGFYRTDSRAADGASDGTKNADGKSPDAAKGGDAAKSDAGSATKSTESASPGASSPKAEPSKPAAAVAS